MEKETFTKDEVLSLLNELNEIMEDVESVNINFECGTGYIYSKVRDWEIMNWNYNEWLKSKSLNK